ncbi:YHYH domain-containing protein [Clostridium disporicum]|uniref:YHYH domain-containing protein n=1 Tax=Clostridium disporicum TaxID=84024 RepID=UPI00361ABDB7
MINKKITKTIIALLVAMPLTTQLAFAHSGRTDSNGGHKDNKNKSGLGSYHYHCGGNPAHLHNNGGCPYSSTSSSVGSSGGGSSTSSQEAIIAAAKKEANDSGYNAGYSAGCNGHEFNNSNSSTYSAEYQSGYSNGYEKGKSELEDNISSAYNEGYALGYKCEDENNTYTVQAVSDSYLKGYREGKRVYIEENTNSYIQYGEEDAHNFVMRNFGGNVPSELKEKYTTAYNKKTTELKEVAYDAGYVQALKCIDSDASSFNNEEEISSYNKGYSIGAADLENEKNAAYEAGYAEEEYSVPEKLSIAEEVVMASYNEGAEELRLEKEKRAKAVTATVVGVLVVTGAGGAFIMKKKKASKKAILDLDKDEKKVS